MNVAVGLVEGLPSVEVELLGEFTDPAGVCITPGRRRFAAETTLTPADPDAAAFALDEVTIGIGFHWERKERQVFRGAFRVLRRPAGLTVVNDVPLEEYVASVISSEMSATCPVELLKAHAVISRSWLKGPAAAGVAGCGPEEPGEIRRWYGREAHPDFEVCADDHCQRYQGITKAVSPAVAHAVRATAGEMLFFGGAICDTRFSKCCGGRTERYDTAWDDQEVPYLVSFPDGLTEPAPVTSSASSAPARRRSATRRTPRSSPASSRASTRRRAISSAGRSRTPRTSWARSWPRASASTSGRSRRSSRSRAARRGGSSASASRASAERSSSARSSRSAGPSPARTSTARRSSWIGMRPAASS
ncbi:MAG: SpoIID/LytB domain-containing protein [Holophagales bacterium]|nr:SpoIID/LytB domain-containing protein [Holophagales bacterium]